MDMDLEQVCELVRVDRRGHALSSKSPLTDSSSCVASPARSLDRSWPRRPFYLAPGGRLDRGSRRSLPVQYQVLVFQGVHQCEPIAVDMVGAVYILVRSAIISSSRSGRSRLTKATSPSFSSQVGSLCSSSAKDSNRLWMVASLLPERSLGHQRSLPDWKYPGRGCRLTCATSLKVQLHRLHRLPSAPRACPSSPRNRQQLRLGRQGQTGHLQRRLSCRWSPLIRIVIQPVPAS